MWINEQTAQLILDALYWSNQDWTDSLEWKWSENEATGVAKNDFLRFCDARGIEGVEKVVRVK